MGYEDLGVLPMAKKIKYSELDSTEKKKLTRVSFFSIASVFVMCVFIVSCFACSQDKVSGNAEMTDEQQKAYWKALLPDTEWVVSAEGILEGQEDPLNATISYESTTGNFNVAFGLEGITVYSGKLALTSCEGTITTEDGKVWGARFTEKNNILYLKITDSNGKEVFFTRNK